MQKRPKRPNGYPWYAVRFKIFQRDKFTCQYCGQSAPDVILHVDHIIALCEGGTDEEDNLITSCYACNRGKEGLRFKASDKAKRSKRTPFEEAQTIWQRVLALLADQPMTAKDLAEKIGITATSMRATLSILKKEGRIDCEKEPRKTYKVWRLVNDGNLSQPRTAY